MTENVAPAVSTPARQEKQETPGAGRSAGRPNGRTERHRKLKAMSVDERKAHRKAWKAAAKVAKPAKPAPAPAAAPMQQQKGKKK